jgi:2-polyprenyl-3-methyl-5-hydroxy-6-metoxy-1,4-benzoquinol methylase
MNLCPICNDSTTKLKFRLKFNVLECKNCEFQFCPDASFDSSFTSNLDEENKEKALKNLRKENFQKIIKSIKENVQNESIKGLEVGPGNGWFLETCIENSIVCDGIEPEVRFNETYSKLGADVTNGFYPVDISKDKVYDFIIFNDVLEHVINLDEVMKTNYALLNSKGVLVINLPIQEGLIYFFARLVYQFNIKSFLNRMWQFNFHSPHLSYFSKNNLIDFASKNNFTLKESYKLKTINLSEISDRINQDSNQGFISKVISNIGMVLIFPFLKIFPDTFCFVLEKN